VCGPSRSGLNHHADFPSSQQFDQSSGEHFGSSGWVVFAEAVPFFPHVSNDAVIGNVLTDVAISD